MADRLADQLERLERCWRDENPDLVDRLRPGLSSAELDAILDSFDYFVPDELREWWGWHNGLEGDQYITEDLQFVRAEDSVAHTHYAGALIREVAGRNDLQQDERYAREVMAKGWPDAHLAIFGGGSSQIYGADCTEPRTEALIRWYSYHDDPHCRLVAHSLREPIARLCDLYDRRLVRWDPQSQVWLGNGPLEFIG